MIRPLKRIGRCNSVIVVTVIASLGATMIAVAALDGQRFDLRSEIAAILSVCMAIGYTISIGLIVFDNESEDSTDDPLARADLALYRAKQAGRNQSAPFNPQPTRAAAG